MNHGHLMLTVKTLYDEGFYLTREEYKEIYGKDLDIETLIEEPQLYIFSRCRHSLQDKGAYTDTRRVDLFKMNVKIRINGHESMVTILNKPQNLGTLRVKMYPVLVVEREFNRL